jgi:hypothetical protein
VLAHQVSEDAGSAPRMLHRQCQRALEMSELIGQAAVHLAEIDGGVSLDSDGELDRAEQAWKRLAVDRCDRAAAWPNYSDRAGLLALQAFLEDAIAGAMVGPAGDQSTLEQETARHAEIGALLGAASSTLRRHGVEEPVAPNIRGALPSWVSSGYLAAMGLGSDHAVWTTGWAREARARIDTRFWSWTAELAACRTQLTLAEETAAVRGSLSSGAAHVADGEARRRAIREDVCRALAGVDAPTPAPELVALHLDRATERLSDVIVTYGATNDSDPTFLEAQDAYAVTFVQLLLAAGRTPEAHMFLERLIDERIEAGDPVGSSILSARIGVDVRLSRLVGAVERYRAYADRLSRPDLAPALILRLVKEAVSAGTEQPGAVIGVIEALRERWPNSGCALDAWPVELSVRFDEDDADMVAFARRWAAAAAMSSTSCAALGSGDHDATDARADHLLELHEGLKTLVERTVSRARPHGAEEAARGLPLPPEVRQWMVDAATLAQLSPSANGRAELLMTVADAWFALGQTSEAVAAADRAWQEVRPLDGVVNEAGTALVVRRLHFLWVAAGTSDIVDPQPIERPLTRDEVALIGAVDEALGLSPLVPDAQTLRRGRAVLLHNAGHAREAVDAWLDVLKSSAPLDDPGTVLSTLLFDVEQGEASTKLLDNRSLLARHMLTLDDATKERVEVAVAVAEVGAGDATDCSVPRSVSGMEPARAMEPRAVMFRALAWRGTRAVAAGAVDAGRWFLEAGRWASDEAEQESAESTAAYLDAWLAGNPASLSERGDATSRLAYLVWLTERDRELEACELGLADMDGAEPLDVMALVAEAEIAAATLYACAFVNDEVLREVSVDWAVRLRTQVDASDAATSRFEWRTGRALARLVEGRSRRHSELVDEVWEKMSIKGPELNLDPLGELTLQLKEEVRVARSAMKVVRSNSAKVDIAMTCARTLNDTTAFLRAQWAIESPEVADDVLTFKARELQLCSPLSHDDDGWEVDGEGMDMDGLVEDLLMLGTAKSALRAWLGEPAVEEAGWGADPAETGDDQIRLAAVERLSALSPEVVDTWLGTWGMPPDDMEDLRDYRIGVALTRAGRVDEGVEEWQRLARKKSLDPNVRCELISLDPGYGVDVSALDCARLKE